MSDLFKRHDETPFAGQVFRNKAGNPYALERRVCGRCGGAGRAEQWAHTGYTCFDCGGNGHLGERPVKLYTCEQIAAMNGRAEVARAKRQVKADAKAAALAAEAEARRQDFLLVHGDLLKRAAPYTANEFIGDVVNKAHERAYLSDKQVESLVKAIDLIEAREHARRTSGHVGKVGERIEAKITVERVYLYDRPRFNADWLVETVKIVTMRDEAGNAIVSKSTRFAPEKGESFTIRATVKEHSEYKGEKQTLVNRVRSAT